MCTIRALTRQWWIKMCPHCNEKVAGQCGQLQLPRVVPAVCPYCEAILAQPVKRFTSDRERVANSQPSPQKVADLCKNSRTPPGAR